MIDVRVLWTERHMYILDVCLSPNEASRFAHIYYLGYAKTQLQVRHRSFNTYTASFTASTPICAEFQGTVIAKNVLSHREQLYKIVTHADIRTAPEHRKQFNAPACNEVAVLMVTEEHGERDIICESAMTVLQK